MNKTKKISAYKKTETLLYNYNSFLKSIEIKEFQIKAIRKLGLENGESEIREIEESVSKTRNTIKMIDSAMEMLKDDKYFDIIRLRYFERKTVEAITEYFEGNIINSFVDVSTISRNNNRLIDKLKIYLFPDEVIEEIMQ